MKTLDEVIELCENILTFAYLPKDDTTSTAGIALFYLREYREIKNHLACMNNAEIRGDSTQIINNPPLTWDELKQMEGEPVWIEMDGYAPVWGIIMNQDKRNGRLCLCGYDKVPIRIEINEDGEGKTWQAYRKERS